MVKNAIDFDALVLRSGAHKSFEDGACLLEAVAYVAGEPYSDHPVCVSPVLAAFGRSWNDGMRSDEERDSLKQYIPRLIGTAGDAEADERRAWMATDWLVRACAPAFLRLTPSLVDHADRLAALQPFTNAAYAASVQGELDAASAAARAAAMDAAWDAAWVAASAAASVAARDAAWVAASAAASVAARDAAWAAAWDAAMDAAWDAASVAASAAARAAARDAAMDAAWDAAWDAASVAASAAARDAARDAASAAARDALEPTVKELQESAHQLFDAMIRAEATEAVAE